jgi:hypothetical protein
MRFHDYAIVVFDEEIDEMGNYVADLLRRGAGVRPARRASLALEVDAEPCGTTRINISRKPNTNSSRITGNSDVTQLGKGCRPFAQWQPMPRLGVYSGNIIDSYRLGSVRSAVSVKTVPIGI